jgi:Metal-dependent hydrolases of the beta-lactamase superfamily I
MKVTFLGTGTSHGVPMIGCTCPVCLSIDPHDKRYRSSLLVENGESRLVIDTGYEFRLQMVRANVLSLSAVLYTHAHMDHVAGLDDLRVFSRNEPFPVYGNDLTISKLKAQYPYAIDSECKPGMPCLKSTVLEPYREYEIAGIRIVPIPVLHGTLPIFGYRFGTFAYITDVSKIPEASYEALSGVKTLAIGALRPRPHATHFSFSEAEEAARKIGADKVYFTHINHNTCYSDINRLFPGYVSSAYDGLELTI